jgi:hypothetical protein
MRVTKNIFGSISECRRNAGRAHIEIVGKYKE